MMFFLNTYGNLIPESQNNPGNLKKKKKKITKFHLNFRQVFNNVFLVNKDVKL